jgi:catechol 2,3-dioxygenase-like lactoylglutathione lyase family enzyme
MPPQRSDLMTEPGPRIDFGNLPGPAEGILVTLFITVRKVARSRDFYSRVLGGTVVLDENPCIVRLSNSWILMNPGAPPPPDKSGISVVDYQPGNTTSTFLNLRVADIQARYEEWKEKGAEFVTPPRGGDPLLHAGPGRVPHRGRPVHRPAARRACREAPGGSPGLSSSARAQRPAGVLARAPGKRCGRGGVPGLSLTNSCRVSKMAGQEKLPET